MVFPGQSIEDALGSREAKFLSSTPGDSQCAQIAKGLTEAGFSVQMQEVTGLHGGFNNACAGLDMQQGAARPAGWEPETAPTEPATAQINNWDFT